jgi:hypothetical protein
MVTSIGSSDACVREGLKIFYLKKEYLEAEYGEYCVLILSKVRVFNHKVTLPKVLCLHY